MIKDGGQAFPRPIGNYKKLDIGEHNEAQRGISLRDWFAGMALGGLCSATQGLGDFEICLATKQNRDRSVTERAYALADAMLAEREVE